MEDRGIAGDRFTNSNTGRVGRRFAMIVSDPLDEFFAQVPDVGRVQRLLEASRGIRNAGKALINKCLEDIAAVNLCAQGSRPVVDRVQHISGRRKQLAATAASNGVNCGVTPLNFRNF